MTDKDILLQNTIAEHVDNNAEALRRLMLIVSTHLPDTQFAILELMSEWHKISREINEDLKAELKAIGEPAE